MAAAESLTAARDDEIQNNFDSVQSKWNAKEILSLSAEGLRRQVAEILTNDADEGFTEVIASNDRDSTPPRVQFNTISTRTGTGRFYRIMRRQDGTYALYGHHAMYRDRHSVERDHEASGVTFLNTEMPPVKFLVIAAPAEATEILKAFLKKGAPASLFEMDFGVGDLKCIGFPGGGGPGERPSITISESHVPTEATGPGARECGACKIRWKSVYGELIDSGELNKITAQGDVTVSASREQTLGLTCAGCGRSLCLEHLGRPLPAGSLTEGNSPCPSCGKRLYYA